MENINQINTAPPLNNIPSEPQNPPSRPQKEIPPEVAKQKKSNSIIEYMGCGLLIYTFVIYAITVADIFAHYVYFTITSSSYDEYTELVKKYDDTIMEHAGYMIAGVVIGVLFLILFFIKALPLKKIFEPHRKMTFSKLMMLICLLMACQLVFFYIDLGVEWLLNQIGLSLKVAIESSQAGSTTISMFLYASFIGPIVEEIIYRGFVMHTFERAGYGKFCSILASAILFGIMHANPTQSIFAIYVGVVFGYAAMEFGIGWSIALHIINNFLFGDCLTFIVNKLPEIIGASLEYAVLIVLFVAGVVIMIVKRKQIITYIRENNNPLSHYGRIFSRISILVFLIINTLFALASFSQLE